MAARRRAERVPIVGDSARFGQGEAFGTARISPSFSDVTRSTHQALADERNATVEIYINGEFFPRSEAKVSVFDSGFLVGDGIWEGIRLHHGEFAFLDHV